MSFQDKIRLQQNEKHLAREMSRDCEEAIIQGSYSMIRNKRKFVKLQLTNPPVHS